MSDVESYCDEVRAHDAHVWLVEGPLLRWTEDPVVPEETVVEVTRYVCLGYTRSIYGRVPAGWRWSEKEG